MICAIPKTYLFCGFYMDHILRKMFQFDGIFKNRNRLNNDPSKLLIVMY